MGRTQHSRRSGSGHCLKARIDERGMDGTREACSPHLPYPASCDGAATEPATRHVVINSADPARIRVVWLRMEQFGKVCCRPTTSSGFYGRRVRFLGGDARVQAAGCSQDHNHPQGRVAWRGRAQPRHRPNSVAPEGSTSSRRVAVREGGRGGAGQFGDKKELV